MAAIHAGRVKLTAADIKFVHDLNGIKSVEDPVKSLTVDDDSSSRDDTKEEFDEIDINHDGNISMTEFKEWKEKQVES